MRAKLKKRLQQQNACLPVNKAIGTWGKKKKKGYSASSTSGLKLNTPLGLARDSLVFIAVLPEVFFDRK